MAFHITVIPILVERRDRRVSGVIDLPFPSTDHHDERQDQDAERAIMVSESKEVENPMGERG